MRYLVRKFLVVFFARCPKTIRKHFIYFLSEAVCSKRESREVLKELFNFIDIIDGFLDRESIRYEGGIHPKHRLTDYHRFFCDRINHGEKVLDVGCGYGSVAASLAESGTLVTAVDLKKENIEKAQEKYGHLEIEFFVMDVTRSIPTGSYDVIVLSNVLEHIEDRQLFLRKVTELIAPKRWLIRVPCINRDWKIPMRRELGISYFSDPTHYTEYTVEQFKREMSSNGLSVETMILDWGEIWAEVKQNG
ncbi:MAG: class I SAM-dependent methyltransferase [Candidatus Electrothrix gigas]